ncbi:MAG: FHA domain-containing protein [Deltaproteobacteria bacterium]|nr:FHA domain-containing protein [Deltaproteobacteria bacterium]MBW2136589.1 FHA domain-containing protein [Deltaproteobacteria bacterium]
MVQLHILNGPDRGKSFDLSGDITLIGRSPDNDVQIMDRTVSRTHLKILRKGTGFFIEDMESRNGTFYNGDRVEPGREVALKEGIPIIIGMTVVCVGKGCVEQIMPFLDSIELSAADGAAATSQARHQRIKTVQKNIDLIYKVSEMQGDFLNRDLEEILGNILDNVFNLLKRVDRAVIAVVEPQTREIKTVVSRAKKSLADTTVNYSKNIVDQVLRQGKPVVMLDTVDEDNSGFLETLKSLKIRSVMCLPLVSSSRILGAIYIDSLEKPYGFRREDHPLFADIGKRIALALENALLHETLKE